MKKEPTNDFRFKKKVISNLTAIVAGGPPPPPGRATDVQEKTCGPCGGFITKGESCGRAC
jgi:hypothetical protein